jgi:F420-non-reducing hydrogenase small subunit
MTEPQAGTGRTERLRIGMYWAAGCGGCDISLLEIAEHLLDLLEVADILFWPCVADFKYRDVMDYPDGHLDVCLVNGAVRSSEHEEVARLLRRKARTLVAYGACAIDGGIPGLANLTSSREIFDTAYRSNPTLQNAQGVEPRTRTETPFGELVLPTFYPQVLRLADLVPVDYVLPGCPPQAAQVWHVLESVIAGDIPATNRAARVGCGSHSVCEECTREKRKVRITSFKRPHLHPAEPGWCLLEQGFVCLGPATRSGCGALCPKAGLTCRGCYGASGSAGDQGTAMLSALGSLFDANTEERALELAGQVTDPVGTFYRFGLASSVLHGRR